MYVREIVEMFLSRWQLLFLSIAIFRMHERDTAIAKGFDIVLQMTLDHVVPQRKSVTWTAKVTINPFKHNVVKWSNIL